MIGSPILAAIYNKMGDRLPMPHKFAIGMVLCSGAFLVLPLGAKFASDAGIVSVNWLILSYALQSIGELMISGLGLAMVAQLVPQRLMGFIMGSWFLTTAGDWYRHRGYRRPDAADRAETESYDSGRQRGH